jgi:DUF4097 and DUF4098 domain-containing protein YvlB
MHRFSTPTPPRLTIEFRAGTMTVHTDDVQDTVVELTGSSDPETQAQIADTVIDQRGDDVLVVVPKRSAGLFGSQPELRLDVTAPHGTRLNVKTASADLNARGRYGESRVTSGSGDVSVEHLTGSAQVRSGSGDVHVGSTDGDLTVGSGSGDVHVGTAGADLTVQTGSGDVGVDAVAGSLKAQTGSGDVEVDRADRDVRAQTASGDLSLRHVVRGRVKAQAASGDLHVGVADGTPAWLDVKTVTGGVTNDLQASEPVGGDEDYVRLDLKTVSGDIEIVRA